MGVDPVVSQEELSQGHLFKFSVTCQGVHRVMGDPTYYDSDWDSEPWTIEVRAFSLSAALEKAAALPLTAWDIPGMMEDAKGTLPLPAAQASPPA